MGLFRKCSVFIAILAFVLPYCTNTLFRLASHPLDPLVGNVIDLPADELQSRLAGKRTLVVGGTKGIGRGIAINLARSGADVDIVGRSKNAGIAVVDRMREIGKEQQSFRVLNADLSTGKACADFVDSLHKSGLMYDFVVMTIGVWPDWENPLTTDGIDKVVAIDLRSRFMVLNGIKQLLKPGARIMNVLASSMRMAPIGADAIKEYISGKRFSVMNSLGMMSAVSYSADAFMVESSRRFPQFKFIGTHPGVVHTDLMDNTFPKWMVRILQFLTDWFQMTISEDECGRIHTLILTSENVDKRPATFFNHLLEGRRSGDIAYEKQYGSWLWNELERISKV